MWIYVIENKKTGDQYIGKTRYTPEHRWNTHLRDMKHYKGNSKLYNAIKKYGVENFQFWGIENTTSQKINEREIYWIYVLSPAYNIARGGNGGVIGAGQKGRRWKIRDTTKMKKKKSITSKVIAGRKRITGSNNYQSTHFIITPWGKFETFKDAAAEAKKLKLEGNKNTVTDICTIKKYCKKNITLNKEGRRTPSSWRGQHTRDIGFDYVIKGKNND